MEVQPCNLYKQTLSKNRPLQQSDFVELAGGKCTLKLYKRKKLLSISFGRAGHSVERLLPGQKLKYSRMSVL